MYWIEWVEINGVYHQVIMETTTMAVEPTVLTFEEPDAEYWEMVQPES